MPTIALVVNAYPRLSESFIANKVRMLADNGYKVTVIVHDLKADAMPPDLAGKACVLKAPSAYNNLWRCIFIIKSILLAPIAYLSLWRKMTNESSINKMKAIELYAPFANKRFDIVHFAFTGLGVTYLSILFFLKKKSVLYISCRGHAEQIKPFIDPVRKAALKKLFAVIDRVHCVSDDMLKTCVTLGLDEGKAFVNRPAINSELFSLGEGEEKRRELLKEIGGSIRIVAVGRLHWKKGYETLLMGFNILLLKGINAHLEIVGAGPEHEKLLYMTHLIGISDRVTFHGALSHANIRAMLVEANVFVHPSLSEGISNAVMEAMAMELAVVSTDAGGTRELITNEQNGLLVSVLNPEALAEALHSYCNDAVLRHRFGIAARVRILSDFTIERQFIVYDNEYTHTLTNSQNRII